MTQSEARPAVAHLCIVQHELLAMMDGQDYPWLECGNVDGCSAQGRVRVQPEGLVFAPIADRDVECWWVVVPMTREWATLNMGSFDILEIEGNASGRIEVQLQGASGELVPLGPLDPRQGVKRFPIDFEGEARAVTFTGHWKSRLALRTLSLRALSPRADNARAVVPKRMSSVEAQAFLQASRHACILPVVGAHVSSRGEVHPCCIAPGERLGNVREQPLRELWNGKPLRALRLRMARDEAVPACGDCYHNEASGAPSQRQHYNRKFAEHADRLFAARDREGHLDRKPAFLDIRFSNLCNFRCRTCGPVSSSRWHADAKALGKVLGWKVPENALLSCVDDASPLLEDIACWFPSLEELYFAGGEPLIIEEHYRLLSRLVDEGQTHMELVYNTNLSVLDFAGNDLARLWDAFRSVTLGVSLDGCDRRGEYLRDGQDFARTMALRQELRERAPRVNVQVSATISALNLLHLPELHRELVARDFCRADGFRINVLHHPDYYRVCNLTRALKTLAAERLEAHQRWIDERITVADDPEGRLKNLQQQLGGLITMMWEQDSSAQRSVLATVTKQLDARRGQNIVEVFPELAEMFAESSSAP